MNNAIASLSALPAAWRGKSPGFAEFNILLNLIDEPVILIDHRRGQVLSANSHLLKLTAFTLAEILSTPLMDLLPEIAQQEIHPAEEHETTINRRNRESITVVARPILLDVTNLWFALILTPLALFQQNLIIRQRQEQLFEALQNLASISHQSDLDSSLKLATQIGHRLLESNVICVYQADSQIPQLRKIAAWNSDEDNLLPDVLPSANLVRLHMPSLWLPGRRVASDLHRTARIVNLNYLASVPLGREGAWLGLLVAADTHNGPDEQILPIMQILGANITTALEHFILLESLQNQIDKYNRSLVIQNVVSENAREGVIYLKPDLSIVEMNPTAELMLGYASQEVMGQQAESILIGTETMAAALKSAIQGIPTHNLGNIKLHRRLGQSFLAHVQTIPVKTNEELLGIVVILSDVSENEQIRVRTQQLEQRAILGEVTAIFAHEVRNPINNISTGLQLMSYNFPPEDSNRELIDRLQHDCARLTHLMESVLSFSRPMEYKLIPTNISELLRMLLNRWSPRLARVSIHSYFQSTPEALLVEGDARALEQVFTNLISNAVQAMSSNGGTLAIKISLTMADSDYPKAEISVSDNGPGIPDEIRDHIFEPFVTTNPQGTGLGLAITKRIITAHKGSISVSSFPGGTVFTVCIPAILGETP
jgi:two-component system, NtrC family, sensor histidine kinase AtoS